MKKNYLLLFAFACLSLGLVQAQAPFHVWVDKIPNSNYASGPSTVEITYDGGYIVAGNDYAQSALNIVKFSANGTVEWSGDFGPGYGVTAYAAIQLKDSGYAAAGIACPLGFQSQDSWDVYVVRTDKNGNLLWSKTYSGGLKADAGNWLQQTLDGGLIIGGYTTIASGNYLGYQNACLIKTDINGNMQWNRTYSMASANSSLNIFKGYQLSDSSYVLGATASSGAVIFKTDKHGNLTWSRQYNFDNGSFYPSNMRMTRDKGYIITGSVSTPSWGAIKIDSTGAVQWAQTYQRQLPVNINYGYSYDVEELAYGYAMVGYFYDSSGYSTSYLMKTNPVGNIMWIHTFNEQYWDWLFSVKQTADYGLIIWGFTQVVNSTERGSLIKTDSTGSGTCKYGEGYLVATSYTGTVSTPSITTSSGITPSNSTNTYPASPATEYFPCLAVPVANFRASDTSICLGSSFTFADLSSNGPAYWHWVFKGGTPDTSAQQNPTVTYDSTGQYDVTLIVSNSQGADTLTKSSYINVSAAPVTGTGTASPDTLCSGNASSITVTGSNGSIQWQSALPDSAFSSILFQNSSVYSTSGLSQTTLYRWIVSNGICADTSAAITIIVNPAPAAPVASINDSLICAADSAIVQTTTGYASYKWNTGDTTSSIHVNQAGGYWVTVTNAYQCTASSNQVQLNVYPVPSVSIIQQGDTLSSFGQVSYQWIRNSVAIDSATNFFYVAHQPGSYAVQIKDTNGCTATSEPVIVSGVQELVEKSISIYPNPSANSWQLTVDNSLLGSVLEVYDEQGRIIFQSKISLLKSKIELDVASGVYSLRIWNEKLSAIKKLVKY